MKVVVPVQNTKDVGVLGEYVRSYPWPTDVEFEILHVVQPVLVNSFMSVLPSPLLEAMQGKRTAEGTAIVKQLADIVKEAFPSATVQEKVVEGDARSLIIEELEDWDADLVLLGAHAKSGFVGSVSRAVVAHSHCSAMIVPLEPRPPRKNNEKLHVII